MVVRGPEVSPEQSSVKSKSHPVKEIPKKSVEPPKEKEVIDPPSVGNFLLVSLDVEGSDSILECVAVVNNVTPDGIEVTFCQKQSDGSFIRSQKSNDENKIIYMDEIITILKDPVYDTKSRSLKFIFEEDLQTDY